jgi:hypothetical protein
MKEEPEILEKIKGIRREIRTERLPERLRVLLEKNKGKPSVDAAVCERLQDQAYLNGFKDALKWTLEK